MEEQNEFRTKKKGNGTTIVIVLFFIDLIKNIYSIFYSTLVIFLDKNQDS